MPRKKRASIVKGLRKRGHLVNAHTGRKRKTKKKGKGKA